MSPAAGNAALLRTLVTRADEIALAVSREKFPILLRKLAERRRITSVEFRPLLVDAMLTTHAHGFRVLFNSRNRDPEELETRYYGENAQQLTNTRIRFSLAHEFVHTLFYDLTSSPPKIAKAFRAGGGKTALENLEPNCDRLAGHLLLPTRLHPLSETTRGGTVIAKFLPCLTCEQVKPLRHRRLSYQSHW